MHTFFAGLDVSTQSCKLVVIDAERRKIVFVDSVNYDNDLPMYGTRNGVIQGQPEGVSESDPRMWIEAVQTCFGRCRDAGIPMDRIAGISVSGQQHGLVSLDAAGNLAQPTSKLWNDFSTQEECRILTERLGGPDAMIDEVGNTQRTGYTAAKIFHMVRHEPEVYANTRTLFLVHNYINFYLTGGVRVMEPGDTSGMALWNPGTGRWSARVMSAIAPDLHGKIPPLKPSDRIIGRISGGLAETFGFSPACVVDAGSGDNMYSAVGTGNVEEGIVTISLGTSGTAYTYMERPFVDPTGEIAAFCDSTGHYLPLLCVSNMANGYDEIIGQYRLNHSAFSEMIRKTRPGNDGCLLIPWYIGERTPDVPKAAPVYFGFGLDDFTEPRVCRAVLEGHVLNLYHGFQRMPVQPREIRLTGGLSQSDAWCQMIADVFGAETVPVEGEGAALGAALHAAWVVRREEEPTAVLKDIVDPFVILDENRRRKPDASRVEVYRKQRRLFDALSRRIRGVEGDDPFDLRSSLLETGGG